MQAKFIQYSRAIVIIFVLLAAAVVIWWQTAYQSPQRTFQDMLVNNLATASVTKNEVSSTSGQDVTQRISLQLSGNDSSRWFVTVQQKDASVTTDSIGTKSAGYVRYTDISPIKDKQAAQKLLGVWASAKAGDSQSALPSLFASSLLDMNTAPVPPIGNPAPEARRNMLDYIRNEAVFTPDYGKVTTTVINGRKVYNFPVSVKLAPYIRLMQAFAHAYGLNVLDNLSASQYQTAQPVKLTLSVDKLSHQLARVSYPTTGFSETYTDYGIRHPVSIPTHTVTEAELQQRLSGVQ